MPNSFYREIVNDHNLRPLHMGMPENANRERRGLNPGCGDDLTLRLRVEDGIVRDGAFTGDGCAISRASADMMLDLVIGKSEAEARRLSALFLRMIHGTLAPEEMDELEEAGALADVAHMPARVKCAVLAWHTMDALLDGNDKEAEGK